MCQHMIWLSQNTFSQRNLELSFVTPSQQPRVSLRSPTTSAPQSSSYRLPDHLHSPVYATNTARSVATAEEQLLMQGRDISTTRGKSLNSRISKVSIIYHYV